MKDGRKVTLKRGDVELKGAKDKLSPAQRFLSYLLDFEKCKKVNFYHTNQHSSGGGKWGQKV